MDRSAQSRKRRQAPGQPTTKPPVRLSREKRQQQDDQKGRAAKSSSESSTRPRRTQESERTSVEDDPSAKKFTVANVGRNGTLYLKPSRATPTHPAQPLATPPRTAENETSENYGETSQRESNISGAKTPRVSKATGVASNSTAPPPSMLNAHQRRRTRSHSFSTVTEAAKAPSEFQLLLNGQDLGQRPKSSVDLAGAYLDLRIPHYRLGTPRFSARGTAYLHNSMTSSVTGDMRSSTLSRAEYDRFPAPPGREVGMSFVSRQQSDSSYLHPSQAASSLNAARSRMLHSRRAGGGIDIEMYNHIEANINDPSYVRYSVSTGRITAATPARLIAQISSPWFLDYELLSDFFLTYRNFLTSHDLLNYLLVRMKWALSNQSDSGRIVTVRTFVAVRHWILNYFEDDFIPDFQLRQRLCNTVNEIATALLQRHDKGASDLNVVGELKKCWRRICAMFWPVPDLMDATPDTPIVPGEEQQAPQVRASATSLAQSAGQHSVNIDFRRSSLIQLPSAPENIGNDEAVEDSDPEMDMMGPRTASIPASPMSEQSLTVLSCSVPFLTHMKAPKEKSPVPKTKEPQKNPRLSASEASTSRHQRSASFTDALRDNRASLSSGHPESVDFRSLPTAPFTGGLVRGLLLQPSPSNVDLRIPTSPPIEEPEFKFSAVDSAVSPQDRQQANVGVKKIVGDVRRVLSTRKRDSPGSSHRSSSDSRNSGQMGQSERTGHLHSWQQLQGPPRVDRLGEKIEGSYKVALQEVGQASIPAAQPREPVTRSNLMAAPDSTRFHSHVTTGSRSIVIMDDTWLPGPPSASGALPPLTPNSRAIAPEPLFSNLQGVSHDTHIVDRHSGRDSSTAVASEGHNPTTMHDLLAVPELWQDGSTNSVSEASQARKSSSAHPAILDMPPIRHQLRRRPGGDLKAADNVQDLEHTPRPETMDSYSTFSQAIYSSGVQSADMSGTLFAEEHGPGLNLPLSFLQGRKNDSWTLLPTHSSQPNMRPSMKAKVSHLAKLPDASYDGGIEDALAKLEGKAASPTASTRTLAEDEADSEMPSSERHPGPRNLTVRNPSMSLSKSPDPSEARSPRTIGTDRQGASIYHFSDDTGYDSTAKSQTTEEVPRIPSHIQTREVPVQDLHLSDPSEKAVTFEDNDEGGEVSEESENRQKPRSPPKTGASQDDSFLLDDNESLSDISTEIAEEQSIDESLGVRSFYFDETVEDEARASSRLHAPPTPPSTVGAPASQSDERSPGQHRIAREPKRSLKEATSAPKLMMSNRPDPQFQERPDGLRRTNTSPSRKQNAHLPFVLAFESEVIAEQLTIIEKDALDEVDWKDLISLNWQHAPPHNRNWVDFLKRDDCNGIDIVVSRFNLAVKWIVSECVLTEAPSERARCITKYIHIAAHCHRLRNYATTYQITLALLSSDLARLHKTWTLVAPVEKQTLERLERLCQPRGNFHQLRVEIESVSEDEGCIPFIGLYTHDLMFNAQKPSRINPTPPGGEPLVNFERYQTAATIVKRLLRLVQSSEKYLVRPHPEVLSRCLWLAALEDHEITIRSKSLEQ